jgi:hypothetical protein
MDRIISFVTKRGIVELRWLVLACAMNVAEYLNSWFRAGDRCEPLLAFDVV